MSKILITGVGGLLGSRLADWIINNINYEVVGIDDLNNMEKSMTYYNNPISDVLISDRHNRIY